MRFPISCRAIRRISIIAAVAICVGGAPAAVHGTVAELPDGIVVVPRPDDGANRVTVEIDGGILAVDPGGSSRSKIEPRFVVATGAGPAPGGAAGATILSPRSRSVIEQGSSRGVVFDTGFTLTDGDREIVFLDLGRVATAADTALWLPVERVVITGRLCERSGIAASRQSDTGAWLEALARLKDLDPLWVIPGTGGAGGVEIIHEQIERISRARVAVTEGLVAGRTSDEVIDGLDEQWFAAWFELDREGATEGVSAIFDELGGLRTPWVLIEDRGLREGASPTRADQGWTRPTKVLWRNRWPERLTMLAQVAPGVEIVPFDDSEEALESVADADAIIGTATAELLAAGERLRWVQVGSAGVEWALEFPRLADGDVLLTNGQRLASPVIAEHVMALIRALARGLNRAVAAQLDGEWRRFEIGDNAPLTGLRGKTLLVVGLGGIGTEVARLADGAGMRVTAIRSSRRSGPSFVSRVGLNEDLETFLGDADVVVNCLPLTPDTSDLFDEELFELMKPSAFFINVGRGGTVDTEALIAALEGGAIAGAGLDVTDPEPLPEEHPLWRAPNLVITPHFAAWSDAGRELHWLLFRENLRRFVAGEPLLSVVDPERGY